MVHIKGVALLVANLESITVQIVITFRLTCFKSDPVLSSSANYSSSIVDTLTILLCVVVRELTEDTIVC